MRDSTLTTQVIWRVVALVILTAAATGLPLLWLTQQQNMAQAWRLVEQGHNTARATLRAEQSDLAQLALLIAQRPTLRAFVVQPLDDPEAFAAYGRTLQTGAGLDALLVCDGNGRSLAQTPLDWCSAPIPNGYYVDVAGLVWLTAVSHIESDAGRLGRVVVALAVDDAFSRRLQGDTELEQIVLWQGTAVASSLTADRTDESITAGNEGDAIRLRFDADGRPYFALRSPLTPDGLEIIVALPVADVVQAQNRLIITMVATILLVTAAASAFSVLLARRIGRPLEALAQAATTLSWRDLEKPVHIQTQVAEIGQVAQALEFARVELKQAVADLQREKAATDRLLASLVEGIMTLDHDGRITFFSPGAARITGQTVEQARYHHCNEVFTLADSPEPFSQFIPAPGERRKVNVRVANGRQITLAITGAQLGPPEEGGVALVFRDVTEEEAINRLLAHFLANVAHEFRTPLSALAASIELLMDQSPDLSAQEFGELLNALHLGILGLQTLVDNLLESASIETGRFRVFTRPCDLRRVALEVGQTMAPLLTKYEQQLQLDIPDSLPIVLADPRRIGQVLVNLIANASKYGPGGGVVRVTAVAHPDHLYFAVADQGPGIPPEARDDLFRWFMRRPLEDDKTRFGIGLGLAVVKAVVQAHQGEVGIADSPGGGARFWFTIPLNKPA
ncbi:MAG: PAS domain S-box protein [Chloroflexi bacterium]|nr:PAS domain S-box protein [Chloroflexota bacterium]